MTAKIDHTGEKNKFLSVSNNSRYKCIWLLMSIQTEGQGSVAMSLGFLCMLTSWKCPALRVSQRQDIGANPRWTLALYSSFVLGEYNPSQS